MVERSIPDQGRFKHTAPTSQYVFSAPETEGYVGQAYINLILAGTPDTGTPTLVNPASSLLQDLLKEQRANRNSRGPGSEGWDESGPRTPEGPRVQEDTASEKARKVSDALSVGQRQPMGMGMREMDQVGFSPSHEHRTRLIFLSTSRK